MDHYQDPNSIGFHETPYLVISGVSMDYRMTYLGQIRQPFPLLCSSLENPVDVQIVDVVEEAQLKGEWRVALCPCHTAQSAETI